MNYGNSKGESFDWLSIDFGSLSYHAEVNGFTCRMVKEGEHYDYLAELQVASGE